MMSSVRSSNKSTLNSTQSTTRSIKSTKIKSVLNLPFLRGHQRYFTNRALTKEDEFYKIQLTPFSVPKMSKLISYSKFHHDKLKDEMEQYNKLRVQRKDNARMAQGRHFNKRLYIEASTDDVKTVTMIHPEFFSVVDGRPIRTVENLILYKRDLANCAMLTQDTGYYNDMRIRIEFDMLAEKKQFEKIHQTYKEHVKCFQKYLAEDHNAARRAMIKAQKRVDAINKLNQEIDLIGIKETQLRNKILHMYDIFRNLKMYKNFLFHIAPHEWRKKYDPSYKEANVLISKFDSDEYTDSAYYVDELLQKIKKLVHEKDDNIHLYYESPEQICAFFRAMELQGQDYAVQLSKRCEFNYFLKSKVQDLKDSVIEETSYFEYFVKHYEALVAREEDRIRSLRDLFFKILLGTFNEMVSSYETMSLSVCITFVIEKVFKGDKVEFDSIRQGMTAIEEEYFLINGDLDRLDRNSVKYAQKLFFDKYRKEMKEAENATVALKQLNTLIKNLKVAFDPPAKFKKPKLEPYKRRRDFHKLLDSDEKSIAEEEIEELKLFYDWCKGDEHDDKLQLYKNFIQPLLDIEVS